MANGTLTWQDEARDLRAQGLSEREIAKAVGKSASSVHEAVKDVQVAVQETHAGDPPAGSNGQGSAEHVPGQQDFEGGEVPARPEPRPEEIVVRGSVPLDFFNAGGKLPNKASVKFVGGKVGLEEGTAFKKGDVIQFAGYATVVSAKPRDKRDRQTGIVIECELQLEAEIDDLRVTG